MVRPPRYVIFCRAVYDEIVFFLRCLVPSARIVSNSAPAAAAWYALANETALPGTALPRHPWPSDRDTADALVGYGTLISEIGVLPTVGSRKRSSHGTIPHNAAVEGEDERSTPDQRSEPCDHYNSRDNEASFAAMASVADTDEWSGALISAGLVQVLVRSLRACLKIRTILGSEVEMAQSVDDTLPSGSVRRRSVWDAVVGASSGFCFTCSLELVQVEVMLAIGGLLSAHPLAVRDRFILANGPLTLARLVSASPCDRDVEHDCSLAGVLDAQGAAMSAAVVAPLVHAHCCLVAVQVMRLCLRAGAPGPLPAEIVQGTSSLVQALPHAMRALWKKHLCGDCCGRDSLFPLDLLRRGRAELERGTSRRCPGRYRQFSPLRCPSQVDLHQSDGGEVWSARTNAWEAGGSSAPEDFCCGGQTYRPSTSPSYLLCR